MFKVAILTLLVIFGFSFLLAPTALAKTASDSCDAGWKLVGCPVIPDRCTDDDLTATSECGVTEMIITLIHIAQWILAIIGSLALFFFVYGGFVWITAAGNSSRVDQGRKILAGTVVGLIIVLAAFQMVRLVSSLLGEGGKPPTEVEKFLEK